MTRTIHPALPLAVALALSSCGGGRPEGNVAVRDAWARETVPGVQISAGYARIENGTNHAVRLTGAETPAAGQVELHSVTTENGVMQMRPVTEGLEIAVGQSVELRPGSYHLMLLDLRQPLRAGERLPVTLRFADGPPVRVDFPIRSAADAAGGRHE